MIANLKQHGIRVAELGKPVEVVASRYEIVNYKQAAREFQGHRMISDVDARSAAESVAVPAGTAVVLTAQPLARLLVNLLEPQSDDGLCTWNFFDADLKQKRFPVLRLEQPATLPLR